jgi:hypothetical protein
MERLQILSALAVLVLFDDTGGGAGTRPGRQSFTAHADRRWLFRDGRLSYSKVREFTRVVDIVGEHRLCEIGVDCDRFPAGADDLRVSVRGWDADAPAIQTPGVLA